jgi:hypothetical protein
VAASLSLDLENRDKIIKNMESLNKISVFENLFTNLRFAFALLTNRRFVSRAVKSRKSKNKKKEYKIVFVFNSWDKVQSGTPSGWPCLR